MSQALKSISDCDFRKANGNSYWSERILLIPSPPLTLQSSVSQPTCCVNFQPPQPTPWLSETEHFQHFLNEFTPPPNTQMLSSHQALILVFFLLFFTCISYKLFPLCFSYQSSHTQRYIYTYMYLYIYVCIYINIYIHTHT